MAELRAAVDEAYIVNNGSRLKLLKGDTIQFNGKTAKVSYFKRGLTDTLIYEIDGRAYALKPEELAMVEKVDTVQNVGGRKTRKSRKSRKNKSRRYRRV